MKIKAVIIGFGHMHVNEVALYIKEQPDFELAAVADVADGAEDLPDLRYTAGWNLKNVRDNYCSRVYDDYRTMLDEIKPDIAFIMTDNVSKPKVVEECAKRGVNVSIEKPVAVDYKTAVDIYECVKKYGIEAVVNWPVMWRPYLHRMKAALDNKIVGEPLKLRYINGHTGPLGKGAKHRGVTENADEMTDSDRAKTWWHKAAMGGGVMLDIGCYGCLLSKWYLGDGEMSAVAYGANLATAFGDTEDNFAAVIKYDNRMSVIEGTWTTPRAVIPSGPMVICTDGAIVCTGGAENNPDVAAYDSYGNKIAIPDMAADEKLKNMPSHYASHIINKTPIHPMLTLEKNVEIMAMLDAVIKSAGSGKEEKIDT